MSDPTLRELLDVATRAAYAAGRQTLAWFNNAVAVEWKADGSPVTIAYREAEALVRRLIAETFPDHAILGEEHGASEVSSRFRWIIDPIDGTKTFVSGVPLYGTLIGVERDGEPVVGVIYMPALDEMVAAAKGLGCTWNGRPCRVSDKPLSEALVVTTDIAACRDRDRGWDRLQAGTRMQRTWADCYAYLLVATGRAEVAMDAEMHPWDCAPMMTIIEEAGGRFTSWDGERTIHGADAVATNGALHDEVLGLLKAG